MNRGGSARCTVVRLEIRNFPGAVRRSVKGPVARCLKKGSHLSCQTVLMIRAKTACNPRAQEIPDFAGMNPACSYMTGEEIADAV